MAELLSKDGIKYIVSRLLENAIEAAKESDENKDNLFLAGRRIAYYEMLDILKAELDVREQDLKEFGLDIDLKNEIA